MGQDVLDISAIFFLNTPNIIPMFFPLCKVVFVYSCIVQMCTPCLSTLSRLAGTISTPLYIFSVGSTYMIFIIYIAVRRHMDEIYLYMALCSIENSSEYYTVHRYVFFIKFNSL